jgi:hypothetical protein
MALNEESASGTFARGHPENRKGQGKKRKRLRPSKQLVDLLSKLTRWVMFGVLIAIIPLAFAAFHAKLRGEHRTLSDIIGHGELFLITVAIAAGGAGQLHGASTRSRLLDILLGGFLMIVILLATYGFGDVSAAHHAGEQVDAAFVLRASRNLFVAGTVLSAVCICVAGKEV